MGEPRKCQVESLRERDGRPRLNLLRDLGRGLAEILAGPFGIDWLSMRRVGV